MGHKYVKEEDTFSTAANGTVPKPTAQDVSNNRFLRADGTWANGGGGGGSEVEADQIVSSGTEIGGVTVDGVRTAFYAPYHNYSTSEQVVGTWVNGKPVYELTISLGTLNYATSNLVDCAAVATMDRLVDAHGTAYNANFNQWVVIPHVHLDIGIYGIALTILKNTNQIRLTVGNSNSWTLTNAYLTMRYTKTTD